MTQYNPNIHHRRSIRLKNFDYSQPGSYYITLCIKDRKCILGKIQKGEMVLNEFGKIIEMVWYELPRHYTNIQLDTMVIMPNHMHAIITITKNDLHGERESAVGAGFTASFKNDGHDYKPAPTNDGHDYKPAPTGKNHGLPEIVRALKTFSARKINELRNTGGMNVWQRNYYEHIIRNHDDYQRIHNYIVNNPLNWESDEFQQNHNV